MKAVLTRVLPIVIISILFITGCSNKKEKEQDPLIQSQKIELSAENLKTDENGLSLLTGEIKTAHGNILFKFYPKQAPATVNRIMQLVENGFYNGLVFHRVIENYLVQTGDPTGKGDGGSGKKIKTEISSLQHIPGTMAMARFENQKDSADSQFYITLSSASHLDGLYTIFGKVVEGLDVLSKINKDDKIISISIITESKAFQGL